MNLPQVSPPPHPRSSVGRRPLVPTCSILLLLGSTAIACGDADELPAPKALEVDSTAQTLTAETNALYQIRPVLQPERVLSSNSYANSELRNTLGRCAEHDGARSAKWEFIDSGQMGDFGRTFYINNIEVEGSYCTPPSYLGQNRNRGLVHKFYNRDNSNCAELPELPSFACRPEYESVIPNAPDASCDSVRWELVPACTYYESLPGAGPCPSDLAGSHLIVNVDTSEALYASSSEPPCDENGLATATIGSLTRTPANVEHYAFITERLIPDIQLKRFHTTADNQSFIEWQLAPTRSAQVFVDYNTDRRGWLYLGSTTNEYRTFTPEYDGSGRVFVGVPENGQWLTYATEWHADLSP